jgi:hypothetical protein
MRGIDFLFSPYHFSAIPCKFHCIMSRPWSGYAAAFSKLAEGKLRALASMLRRDPALAGLAAVFAVALVMVLGGVSSEWLCGTGGRIGAKKSIQARNYLKFGIVSTRLAPLDNAGPARDASGRPAPQEKDWRSPPGFALLLSLVVAVFGRSETAARLLAAAMTLAALLMLVHVLRKAWGDGGTILSFIFLTFIPIQAVYMNFVGSETMALLSMTGVIFSCEYYTRKRTWRRIIPMACFTLAGAFSDFSFYLFAAYFFPVILLVELVRVVKNPPSVREGSPTAREALKAFSHGFMPGLRGIRGFLLQDRVRKSLEEWKGPAVFAAALLGAGILALLQMRNMQPAAGALTGLLRRWHHAGAPEPYLAVLKRWDYYLGLLNPAAILLAAYWILDLLVRTFLLKLRRADGYVAALFASAITAWLLVPQAALADERAALAFACPVALAAGEGLWRFAASVSYGSRRLRVALAALIAAVFVLYSIPRIHAGRISPLYEFTLPLHRIHSPKNYDFDLSMNIMARFMGGRMGPAEKLAVSTGLDPGPQFDYYLDHARQSFHDRLGLLRLGTSKEFSFIFTSRYAVWSDFLSHLVKKHDFVFYDRYYGFDLKKKLKRAVFLERVFRKDCPLVRYLRSLSTLGASVRENHWRSLDFALKARSRAEADRIRKEIGAAKPESLEAAVAMYNDELSRGANPDLEKVEAWLNAPAGRRRVYGSMVEYLGATLRKRPDGRTVLQMLFRVPETPDYNFKADITAEPLHEEKTLREEIGTSRWEIRPLIPSTMWKAGYLYILEDELQLFPGPYRLSFAVAWFDFFQIFNSASNENAFEVECRKPGGDPLEALARVTSKMREIDILGAASTESVRARLAGLPEVPELVEKDLGEDLVVHGCLAAQAGKDRWVLRFFMQNLGLEGRDVVMRVMGEGSSPDEGFEASVQLGNLVGERGSGRVFWAEETVAKDPSKARIRIEIGTKPIPNPLKTGSGQTDVVISEGNYGIDFPISWLLVAPGL